MINRRFLLSWIASSVAMFGVSYLWHGIVLNDFNRLNYPKGVFFITAAVVYLVIGLLVARACEIRISIKFLKNPLAKGVVMGAFSGFIIYLVAMVIGVSFMQAHEMKYMLFNIACQMVEQGVGGIAVGIVHLSVYHEEPADVKRF